MTHTDTIDTIDIKRLTLIMRRNFSLILWIMSAFFLLSLLYLWMATPQYRAQTLLFLDRGVTESVSEIASIKQTRFEAAAIDSEVEIIQSQNITSSVIGKIKEKGYFSDLLPDDLSVMLPRGLDVRRVGETYILKIMYRSDDPQKSADIANAYAQSYVEEKLTVSSEMSTRTVSWLQSKIDELRQQSINSAKAVTEYRGRYNQEQQSQKENDRENGDDPDKKFGLEELRSLEQESETYHALYDSYLERLKTLNLQESFPLTETRIITHATPPADKSHPKTLLIVGMALILGIGIGVLTALLRDHFDKTLRRAGQVKREVGIPFLGFFPERKQLRKHIIPFMAHDETTHHIHMHAGSIEDSFSLYSDVVRTVINTADQKIGVGKKKVIGVISVDQSESQSIVSQNLALYIAQSVPSILMDGDIRKESAFLNNVNSAHMAGFGEVLVGQAPLKEGVLYQESSPLALLPSLGKDAEKLLPQLNASSVKKLIDTCKKHYEYVVIDCPSLLAPSDLYGFIDSVDGFVVVGQWGKTISNNLNFYLKQNNIDPDKLLGVILENTDMRKMQKLYGHRLPA